MTYIGFPANFGLSKCHSGQTLRFPHESRSHSAIDCGARLTSGVPEIRFGNMPIDGGHLVLDPFEKDELLRKDPDVAKYVRPYIGAEEFINGKERYCLWLKDVSPSDLRLHPALLSRVDAVKQFRLASCIFWSNVNTHSGRT